MLFMKEEIFGIQKSAMPLLFSDFNFLLIYKADSAGSRTYPFLSTAELMNPARVNCLSLFLFAIPCIVFFLLFFSR